MTENKRFENRLNKDNVKFNTLNPVWDNEKEDALNVFEMIELLNELHEEKDYWKKRCLLVEKKYGELPSKVKLKNIIGLVKTDEPTNSVELKKELYK